MKIFIAIFIISIGITSCIAMPDWVFNKLVPGDRFFTENTNSDIVQVYYGSVAFGDIDTNGTLDLIVTGDSGSGNVTKMYTNDGRGKFTEILNSGVVDVYRGSIALGDIDTNGTLDLIVTGNSGSPVSKIYTNDGSGIFTEIYSGSLAAVYNGAIALGDINNDTRLDLILTGYTGGVSISKIYTNNGIGFFDEINAGSLVGVSQSAVALGDINANGTNDLILSGLSATGNILKIYTNDGSGNFTEINTNPLTGVYDSSVVVGDIDGDKDLDLVVTGHNGLEYVSKIYQNDGTGVFTETNEGSLTGVGISSIKLVDIDNDGDSDLILTGTGNSDPVSLIYRNNGSGSFTEINTGSLLGVQNSAIDVGDIDGDGDIDLIITGEFQDDDTEGVDLASKIYRNNFIRASE